MTSSIFTQLRRPKFLFAFLLPVLMLTTGCNEESKAKKAVINDLESKLHQESEKLYGKNPKGVVKEFADAIESKRDWTVTEMKIEGDKAQGKIMMKGMDKDEVGGLFLLLAFGADEMDKKKLSINDMLKEMKKKDSRAPASLNEIKVTETEYNFTAKKDGDSFRVAKFDEVPKSKK